MRLSALSLVKVLVEECFVLVEDATHSPSPNSPMGASSPKSDMMVAGNCNARKTDATGVRGGEATCIHT